MDETLRTRVIIADDHPLFRGALRQAVAGLTGPCSTFESIDIGEAGSFEAVVELLRADPTADLVLLDLTMPGVRGYSGLLMLRAEFPVVPVVVVSAQDDPSVIRRCLDLGASGFIPKTLGIEAMREAIRQVLDGQIYAPAEACALTALAGEGDDVARRLSTLTPQQLRVLMMLSEGLLNKQIAYELSVSEATVKAHVSAILQKLDVDSRTQAVIAASKLDAGQWPSRALNG